MDIAIKNIPEIFLNNVIKLRIQEKFNPCEGNYVCDVYVEKRSDKPNKYCITWVGSCMDKDGDFIHEPMPSGRTDEYLSDTRFDSIEEAIECFNKHYK